MTGYVDDFRVPAKVGGTKARWSHLTADTPAELHAFAERLGLLRKWFQARCKDSRCPTRDGACVHYHYDVVDAKRTEAIGLGATSITYRQMAPIMSARRQQYREAAK